MIRHNARWLLVGLLYLVLGPVPVHSQSDGETV